MGNLDRDFQRYHGGPNAASGKRFNATISSQHIIRLNRNVHALIGKPAAVYLNYSPERDTIALEPTSPRLAEAFLLIPEGPGFRINAAPFCRNFGIKIDATLKFIRPEPVGDALYLKLSETVCVSRKRKR